MILEKHKKMRGSSRTRVEYTFGKNHDHKCEHATFLGGNVYTSLEPGMDQEQLMEALIAEMDAPSAFRSATSGKESGNCHTHYSVSLAPGEHLSLEDWQAVSNEVMQALGYTDEHKWYAVLHEDTGIQHIHLCGNRTSMETGLLLSESNDYEDGMKCLRRLEKQYQLTVVPMPGETWGVQLKRDEIGQFSRTNETSPDLHWKHMLIARIAASAEKTVQTKGNMVNFVKTLRKCDVKVEFTIKADEISGISYEFRGNRISGRDLKRTRCTFKALIQKEKIPYEKNLIPKLSKIASFRTAKDAGDLGRRGESHPVSSAALCTTLKSTEDRLRAEKGLDSFLAIQVKTSRLYRPIIARRLQPTRITDDGMLFAVRLDEEVSMFWEIYGRLISYIINGSAMVTAEFSRSAPATANTISDFKIAPTDGPIYQLASEEINVHQPSIRANRKPARSPESPNL